MNVMYKQSYIVFTSVHAEQNEGLFAFAKFHPTVYFSKSHDIRYSKQVITVKLIVWKWGCKVSRNLPGFFGNFWKVYGNLLEILSPFATLKYLKCNVYQESFSKVLTVFTSSSDATTIIHCKKIIFFL